MIKIRLATLLFFMVMYNPLVTAAATVTPAENSDEKLYQKMELELKVKKTQGYVSVKSPRHAG